MPKGLVRHQQAGHLHFITISCYRHTAILETPSARNTLQQILEDTRKKYAFQILGYVFMSNHIHLLITEPEGAKLSTALQVVKQRFSRTRSEEFVWEPRYHDFNVFTEAKRIEKLRYMHRNPIKAGLVEQPDQWQWSSFRVYAYQEEHPIHITTRQAQLTR